MLYSYQARFFACCWRVMFEALLAALEPAIPPATAPPTERTPPMMDAIILRSNLQQGSKPRPPALSIRSHEARTSTPHSVLYILLYLFLPRAHARQSAKNQPIRLKGRHKDKGRMMHSRTDATFNQIPANCGPNVTKSS